MSEPHQPDVVNHTFADVQVGEQFVLLHPRDGKIVLTVISIEAAGSPEWPDALRIRYRASDGRIIVADGEPYQPHHFRRKE